MNRNYIIFGGIALLAIGIFVAVTSYTSAAAPSKENNTLIENGVISPKESQSAAREVKAGQNMQLVIHYPLFGASINAKIKDPNGSVVSDINSNAYNNELYATFTTATSGEYTVTITNLGNDSMPVHVILGNISSPGENKNPFK